MIAPVQINAWVSVELDLAAMMASVPVRGPVFMRHDSRLCCSAAEGVLRRNSSYTTIVYETKVKIISGAISGFARKQNAAIEYGATWNRLGCERQRCDTPKPPVRRFIYRTIGSVELGDEQEEKMLKSLKKALGLDEEGIKRRQKAREKAREEERRERAERVRQDAEAMKKSVGE